MKKISFLLGLLCTAACLTACGSKDFNMSFEEALEIANHSELQNILSQNDNFEQIFDIAWNFDYEWTQINASLSSNNKQNLNNKNSESSTKFNANITAEWETIKIDWALDVIQTEDVIYLNLSSLDLTWNENLWFISAMIEAYKNQWFSLSMTGLSEVSDTLSILRDSGDLNEKSKEIITNEWSTVYNGKFTQFNWYNARKFSLDNEKLNALIKEYYESMNKNLNEEYVEETPELNIQNFEWYLVITWKDKVTTVIENMDILNEDTITNTNWFWWENFELNMSSEGEIVLNISATKKGSKYDISASIANMVILEWTISPKLSKSSIDLKYDLSLTIKSEEEWETDIIVPFKGSWKYNSISEFTTTAPESAQDLNELLWAYLGDIAWWDDYEYDYEYDDKYAEDYDYDLYNEYAEEIENINTEEWESLNSEEVENLNSENIETETNE